MNKKVVCEHCGSAITVSFDGQVNFFLDNFGDIKNAEIKSEDIYVSCSSNCGELKPEKYVDSIRINKEGKFEISFFE